MHLIVHKKLIDISHLAFKLYKNDQGLLGVGPDVILLFANSMEEI